MIVGIDTKGQPIQHWLIWMDWRAENQIADIPADEILKHAGVILDPTHMAAKFH